MKTKTTSTLLAAAAALGLVAGGAYAQSVDVSAAEALAKKSGCTKCHAVSAKKEGPSFKETAAKYKGKPDAEKALFTHLTTNPKVKVDGKEEMHDAPKTKNEAEIKNLVQYILSR
jgi:cytochrome c